MSMVLSVDPRFRLPPEERVEKAWRDRAAPGMRINENGGTREGAPPDGRDAA